MGTLAITIFPGGRPSAPYRHAESHQFTRCIQAESPGLAAAIAVLAALGGLLLKVKSDSWVLPVVLFVVAAVSGGLTFFAARASRQEKARQLVENTSELSRGARSPWCRSSRPMRSGFTPQGWICLLYTSPSPRDG